MSMASSLPTELEADLIRGVHVEIRGENGETRGSRKCLESACKLQSHVYVPFMFLIVPVPGVPLGACLAGWGKHWRSSSADTSRPAHKKLSRRTKAFDNFLSHLARKSLRALPCGLYCFVFCGVLWSSQAAPCKILQATSHLRPRLEDAPLVEIRFPASAFQFAGSGDCKSDRQRDRRHAACLRSASQSDVDCGLWLCCLLRLFPVLAANSRAYVQAANCLPRQALHRPRGPRA